MLLARLKTFAHNVRALSEADLPDSGPIDRSPTSDFWYGQTIVGDSGAITPLSAMRLTAVMACVRIISDSVAQLPLHYFQRRRDGGRDKLADSPIYRLLHDNPNRYQSAYEWRKLMQAWLLLRGNAYAEIQWSAAGRPIALHPIHPDTIKAKLTDDRQLIYRRSRGENLPAWCVLHIRGVSDDGIEGMSPISESRRAVRIATEAERWGESFLKNDICAGERVTVPGKLKPEAKEALRLDLMRRYGGSNRGTPAILENGIKSDRASINNEDAQYLETREFQVTEIARLFGVPPHMIASTERSTSWGTGIEQQTIGFALYTISPWLENWRQALRRSLLTPTEQRNTYFDFDLNALLKADSKTRYEVYQMGLQNGILTRNEIRQRENLDPLPSEVGDSVLRPGNIMVEGQPNADSETDKLAARLAIATKTEKGNGKNGKH